MKIALLVLLFLGACSSLSVTSQRDQGYDFSHASTFSFASNPHRDNVEPSSRPSAGIESSIVRRNLRRAILETMAQKGISYQDQGGQVLVSYYANMAKKKRLVATYPDYGWDYGYGMDYGYGFGFGSGWRYGYDFAPISEAPFLNEERYQEGTVIIDVIDPASKRLVWRGTGVRDISARADETALKIQKTTQKILRNFPPR